MARKLGTIATRLLTEARERGRIGVSRAAGRGPQDGKVQEGGRDWAAALRLVKLGLLQIKGDPVHTAITRRGRTVRIVDVLLVPTTKQEG